MVLGVCCLPIWGLSQRDTTMSGISAEVVVTGTMKEVKRVESQVLCQLNCTAQPSSEKTPPPIFLMPCNRSMGCGHN
ncbi:MAG: hypothetical protein RL596_1224 [Bacteroidota bacterium]